MTLRRRDFLRGAALAAGSVAAHGLRIPAYASPPRGAETVAIFGGGVGGLTVAHELAERGFAVTVFERRAWGGKARSHGVPNSARAGRAPLPAEHSPHFFPGIYQNIPDTFRRIPFGSNPNGVFDNLVAAPEVGFARTGERSHFVMDAGEHEPAPTSPAPGPILALLTHLPPHEAAYFVDRMLVFMSSCEARRSGQWEVTSWWDFSGAERFSDDYQKLAVDFFTRVLAAQPLRETSARAIATFIEQIIYQCFGFFGTGPANRIFDRPKNEAFIDPWVAHLESLGVDLRLDHSLTGFDVRGSRIAGADLTGPNGAYTVTADHYVCALPVECARRFWTPAILAADPSLEMMNELSVRWAAGIQYYLRRPTPLARGHVIYVDSPWALLSISEAQFWPESDLARDYGDGSAAECLSVAISDLDIPGAVFGRAARDMSPDEIARDVWVQMQQHFDRAGEPRLADGDVVSWHLDPGLVVGPSGTLVEDLDPLFSHTVGSWSQRPTAATAIPNLFLAADYVRGAFPLTTTEAANEAGRRAANAILEASSSSARSCRIFDPYRSPVAEPFQQIDEVFYRQGLPHAADVPGDPTGRLAEMKRTLSRTLGLDAFANGFGWR